MHGRIIRLSLAFTRLAFAPSAHAHDVHIKAIHASVPTAAWDAQMHTWTLELAGMIDCDANSERADGAVFAQAAGGDGPLAALLISGKPRQIFREQHGGLAPGDYELVFAAAACSAQPQN